MRDQRTTSDARGGGTRTEKAVAALVLDILRSPPSMSACAHFARMIDEGTLDWVALAQMLRANPAYRETPRDPEDRRDITERIKTATRSRVLAGPFAGMRIGDGSSRGDGDLAPKLLGTYEQELHAVIRDCAQTSYDAVVDIGAAEGYYAIGLALMLPTAPIIAFEADAQAHVALTRNAARNACQDRIALHGRCDLLALRDLLERYPRALVLCDCEGDEARLLADPAVVCSARSADLLIECHDHWDATITPNLVSALSPTHAIVRIDQGGRDPNAVAFLADLDEWDRWRAIWERRGPAQHWLMCRSRESHTPDGGLRG